MKNYLWDIENPRRYSNQMEGKPSEDLKPDDEYYHDPKYAKYQQRLKRMREEYKELRSKFVKKMKKDTIHWEEIGRLKRAIGSLTGILKMIEEGC